MNERIEQRPTRREVLPYNGIRANTQPLCPEFWTHQGCPGSGFDALPRKALVRRGVEGGTLGRASLGHGTDDEPAQDRYEARPRGAFFFTAAATEIAR